MKYLYFLKCYRMFEMKDYCGNILNGSARNVFVIRKIVEIHLMDHFFECPTSDGITNVGRR